MPNAYQQILECIDIVFPALVVGLAMEDSGSAPARPTGASDGESESGDDGDDSEDSEKKDENPSSNSKCAPPTTPSSHRIPPSAPVGRLTEREFVQQVKESLDRMPDLPNYGKTELHSNSERELETAAAIRDLSKDSKAPTRELRPRSPKDHAASQKAGPSGRPIGELSEEEFVALVRKSLEEAKDLPGLGLGLGLHSNSERELEGAASVRDRARVREDSPSPEPAKRHHHEGVFSNSGRPIDKGVTEAEFVKHVKESLRRIPAHAEKHEKHELHSNTERELEAAASVRRVLSLKANEADQDSEGGKMLKGKPSTEAPKCAVEATAAGPSSAYPEVDPKRDRNARPCRRMSERTLIGHSVAQALHIDSSKYERPPAPHRRLSERELVGLSLAKELKLSPKSSYKVDHARNFSQDSGAMAGTSMTSHRGFDSPHREECATRPMSVSNITQNSFSDRLNIHTRAENADLGAGGYDHRSKNSQSPESGETSFQMPSNLLFSNSDLQASSPLGRVPWNPTIENAFDPLESTQQAPMATQSVRGPFDHPYLRVRHPKDRLLLSRRPRCGLHIVQGLRRDSTLPSDVRRDGRVPRTPGKVDIYFSPRVGDVVLRHMKLPGQSATEIWYSGLEIQDGDTLVRFKLELSPPGFEHERIIIAKGYISFEKMWIYMGRASHLVAPGEQQRVFVA